MNKVVSILIFICIAAAVLSIATFSLIKNEERIDQCNDLCSDKNMEYFNYHVGKRDGVVFCECLNDGVENKFALTRKQE